MTSMCKYAVEQRIPIPNYLFQKPHSDLDNWWPKLTRLQGCCGAFLLLRHERKRPVAVVILRVGDDK